MWIAAQVADLTVVAENNSCSGVRSNTVGCHSGG